MGAAYAKQEPFDPATVLRESSRCGARAAVKRSPCVHCAQRGGSGLPHSCSTGPCHTRALPPGDSTSGRRRRPHALHPAACASWVSPQLHPHLLHPVPGLLAVQGDRDLRALHGAHHRGRQPDAHLHGPGPGGARRGSVDAVHEGRRLGVPGQRPPHAGAAPWGGRGPAGAGEELSARAEVGGGGAELRAAQASGAAAPGYGALRPLAGA